MTNEEIKRNKKIIILFLWIEKMNEEGVNIHNHDFIYDRGWFRLDKDSTPVRYPDLVKKADDMAKSGYVGKMCKYKNRNMPEIHYKGEDTDEDNY